MSDTEAMIRLIDHAAEVLRARITDLIALGPGLNSHEHQAVTMSIAAMSNARATLKMLSASVAPENNSAAIKLANAYAAWAEANDGVTMSDGELQSIIRFLRESP